jgi:hypothetical protein
MTIHILGGGTFSHVRSHLALAAPAFGGTARYIASKYFRVGAIEGRDGTKQVGMVKGATLHLTKMADPDSKIVTNDDVKVLLDQLIADPETRVIYFNMALCDFDGDVIDTRSGYADSRGSKTTERGKYADRLKTREGQQFMLLSPAEKLIGRIRKERKDIFVVGFKTTAGASSDEQYQAGLNLLKANSLNLVVANDIVTRNNMIIAPEETRYSETTDRGTVMDALVDMVEQRRTNTFTRSTVVEGALVNFMSDDRVPGNLREVVTYLVSNGAYKPFRGATAGHFAVKIDDNHCLTSRRKTDYTKPGGLDLVEIEYDGFSRVFAMGAKPSVGGQSQRIVFSEHPDLDCIVHAHIPLRSDAPDAVPVAEQAPYECGSHQCGLNTSQNLRSFDGGINAVMLDSHGPNIVFSRHVDPSEVIDFIERNFDVGAKTGGLVVTPGLVAEPA